VLAPPIAGRASARRHRLALGLALSVVVLAGSPGCRTDDRTEAANPSAMATLPSLAASPGDRSDTGTGDASAADSAAAESRELGRVAWDFQGRPGQLIRTPNYEIHTTIRHEQVVDRLPIFMEAALAHYRTAIMDLPAPPRPMPSFVFHDREDWETKTVEVVPEQAGQLRGLGRGGYSTRGIAVLYYLDWSGRSRDTLAIAAHEGWHQYTQTTFRDQLPLWLEEGLATYMEGHRWGRPETPPEFQPQRNWERWSTLRSVIGRDRLIPLRELVSRSPQEFLAEGKGDLLTYYAQVWALTRFLLEHDGGRYREALERILRDAVDGSLHGTTMRSPRVIAAGGRGRMVTRSRVGPWLLLAYVTEDLRSFEAEYEQYCRDLVSGRGRQPGPAPGRGKVP
jgi:hypothetical protein